MVTILEIPKEKNWYDINYYEPVITKRSENKYSFFAIGSNGSISGASGNTSFMIRPTFYLNASITYVSGEGTETNPIRIN